MTNEELSDTDLFNEAMGEGEPQDHQQTEQVTEQEPEAQETQVETQQTQEEQRQQIDDNAPQVPSWRVREINEEKRRFAEENERMKAELAELRRASQQQQHPQPTQTEQKAEIDPLIDPKGYAKQVREEIRNELLNERREESLQTAAEKYGDEFKEAYTAAQQKVDPALRARMQSSRNPGETLIQWHREQKTMREVGSDPNAWLEKKLEERLKDPAFLAKAVELAQGAARQQSAPQTNGRPRVELPPSLSSASRSNAAIRGDATQDVSDRELFQQLAG